MFLEISLYDIIGIILSVISLGLSLFTYLESKPHLKMESVSGTYIRVKKYDMRSGKQAIYKGIVEITLINKSASPISVYRITLENIDYVFSEEYTTKILPEDEKSDIKIMYSIEPIGATLRLPLYIEPYSSVKSTLVFKNIEMYIGERNRKIIYPNNGYLTLKIYTSRKILTQKVLFNNI